MIREEAVECRLLQNFRSGGGDWFRKYNIGLIANLMVTKRR